MTISSVELRTGEKTSKFSSVESLLHAPIGPVVKNLVFCFDCFDAAKQFLRFVDNALECVGVRVAFALRIFAGFA